LQTLERIVLRLNPRRLLDLPKAPTLSLGDEVQMTLDMMDDIFSNLPVAVRSMLSGSYFHNFR